MSTAMSATPGGTGNLLEKGYAEKKTWMKRAHADLRKKGVSTVREKSGNEYRITEEVVQIVLKDGRMVQYNTETDSIFIIHGNDSIPFSEAQNMARGGQTDLTEVSSAIARIASLADEVGKRKDLEVQYQPNYQIGAEMRYNTSGVIGTGSPV